MREWGIFMAQLRARTNDKVLLWSVDLADTLAKRMSTMAKHEALAVAGVVFRGMAEATDIHPVELFEALADEGYLGEMNVTVVHIPCAACTCARCLAAAGEEQNPKDVN
jgi:hypothetical protein